ncbi:acyl-CoA dehydrogenase family protein [Actinoplanes sp. NPDC049599]|uniref:acyl-CoA dehydrogenase family protein n=1 Tax=Actinoplanes sp. NPDC049599 TaxID=3363903 RepID=UPI00378E00B6
MTQEPPTHPELVRRACELVPLIQKFAGWSEENRRAHDEVINAMTDAGIFRMRTPARYGGYESDTRTLAAVATELARGDGSAAWVASVHWIPTWIASQFPAEVQAEIFADPDVRICGTLSPTAMAAPAPGGVVVNGKWGFITGAPHSQWQEIIAVLVEPDREPAPIVALVPMSDLQIVDDWQTSGLRGTGSVSTIAQDVFVPQARILPLGAVMQGGTGAGGTDGAIYRAPLLPVASASSAGTALGLAKAAYATFLERLEGRRITYTDYASQQEAPLTHLQVAEAAMKIDQAEFHVHRLTSTVDSKAAQAHPWTLEERVRARADMGAAVRLAREAVDVLADASGGSSIFSDVPIQRIRRDIQALSLHALMHPDTNAELYGRILCGQPPNTQYV